MRKTTEGEKKAIQILAAERIASISEPSGLLDDPMVLALYAYLLGQGGMMHPRGGWIAGVRSRTIGNRRIPGIWIPFPREVQPCCKVLKERHCVFYGGYWAHCLGIKHQSYKLGVPYKTLRQVVYYYYKHKGGRIKTMGGLKANPVLILAILDRISILNGDDGCKRAVRAK